ncbi:MAG: DUF72 domain-containing protein [Polyangiaceae bacterium]|nr:DUF72 domain-containing protein [Polyangiaceae bacterium]
MITVGCAGFPVPATRYFREFLFVEVQETHLGTPGPGTVRRWRREAPEGFQFSVLGAKEIGLEGFREGPVIETALNALSSVAKDLEVDTAVFVVPVDFQCTKDNKAVVKSFLAGARKYFKTVVFDPGTHWDPDETESLLTGENTLVSRDPLNQGLSKKKRAYYRLPGPAGHKSRYEDPVIDKLAEIAKAANHTDVTYVFTNVDMFADAKRFRKGVKG